MVDTTATSSGGWANTIVSLVLLLTLFPSATSLSFTTTSSSFSSSSPIKVLVTGASTSVGAQVFKKLLKSKTFQPVGLVRDKRGRKALKKLGATDDQIRVGDITRKSDLTEIFADIGAKKAVLCTSAKPKKKWFFQLLNFLLKLIGRDRIPQASDLFYPKGQDPYHVDFLGQKNVIDACLEAKVEHIVMLGNMGGYRGISKLNNIGRREGDGIKMGNLLKWKRAAERYLMKRCFFTIVHSGALVDDKGGRREIVWDTDDSLLRTNFRKIPREDVAEVLVQALIWKEAIGRSIDIASRPEGQGAGPTKDWLRFWSRPGNCCYPADFDDYEI